MTIRSAERSDIPALAALWAAAFPGERSVEQRIAQLEAGGVYGGIETAFIIEAGASATASGAARAVGGFRTYALQQYVHGALMPMMGLAAVAVDASERRQGVAAEMCCYALRHARLRGDVLSALYPFRPSYYAALGWSLAGSLHAYRFAPRSLRVTHAHPRVERVADPVPLIAPLYERVASNSNGLISRTDRIWRQHLDWPDVQAVVLRRGRDAAAYAIIHLSSDATSAERVLTIRELIASDEDAYSEMLSWFALQTDVCDVVAYDALPSENFDLRLTEPRTPGKPVARTLYAHVAAVLRGPMSRLVNVRKALELREDWRAGEWAFVLYVEDDFLPDNAGVYEVEINNRRASVRELPDDSGAIGAGTTLRCDIGVLTQIYLGEVRASVAARMGLAEIHGDAASLDAAFEVASEFVLLDEF